MAKWTKRLIALGGVLAALASIATISLWIAPGWSPGASLRAGLLGIWNGLLWILTARVPLWVVLVFFGSFVFFFFRKLVDRLKVPANAAPALPAPAERPEWMAYRSDVMFEVLWNWQWGDGVELAWATALCRYDLNELVALDVSGHIVLNCTLCGRSRTIGRGFDRPADIAAREVRRRVRTGEWRGAAERLAALPDPKL